MSDQSHSQETDVTAKAGVTIGGAPVAYTAILAALVAVLAFIPASVVVGGMGGGWPFWDVITPAVGLLLGPIAGPIAAAIGVVVGGVVAPYTNLGPWGFLIGAMAAFTVAMTLMPRRSMWYVPWVITATLNVIYWFQAEAYGIGFGLWWSNVFTVHIALILIAIPQVRNWAIAQIRTGGMGAKTFSAFAVVFFFGSTAGIQANWVPAFATNPWPAEVWPALVVIILVERVVFTLVGALIAMALVTALRRSNMAKADMAGY
ncbi:MAG: hypothetical protein ACLFTP_01115 [Rhodosalinus sp.]|uniref:hypothetical protein n=1 Tax=Rhodosalinus sp. TaxID=2047741 RepID=UPI00397C464D